MCTTINEMIITKRKPDKSSRGYRLKKSTHNLIEKIQLIMKADQDKVITKACKMLYRELVTYNRK